MAGFICPFCNHTLALSQLTYRSKRPSFYSLDDTSLTDADTLQVTFYLCPNCNQTTITAEGLGPKINVPITYLHPISQAKQFPDYIPLAIRNDYEEAYAIVNLSPKASATLARRCLQGMIHDYWNIKLRNLNQEITALKEHIPADLWNAIDSLRQLGNIGAHMEKDTDVIIDIEPSEATNLIKLIELLMKEWYINRHERQQLFSSILSTNDSKQEQRTKNQINKE